MVSIPGVMVAALLLTVLAPVWLPLAVAGDAVRGWRRLPVARVLLFALCWAWLETVSLVICGGLWLAGQARNMALHYRLQAWWAASLIGMLQAITGIRVLTKIDGLAPGPAVVLCRHASLADSLVSAWVISGLAGLQPRYVLKKELRSDPCLDVVGNRLANHFLDRAAADSAAELRQLQALSRGMTANDVTVIFPEGTRSNPAKRTAALEKIGAADAPRAQRLAPLTHLLPPRPAGTEALLEGHPAADVVIAWHTGFDGLDTFGGIIRHLASTPPPARFATWRVPRYEVPTGDGFTSWLDEQWLAADRLVTQTIAADRVVR